MFFADILGLCKGECPCCKPAYQNSPIWYEYEEEGPAWGWGDSGWGYDNGWGWSRRLDAVSNRRVPDQEGTYVRVEGKPTETNKTTTVA